MLQLHANDTLIMIIHEHISVMVMFSVIIALQDSAGSCFNKLN